MGRDRTAWLRGLEARLYWPQVKPERTPRLVSSELECTILFTTNKKKQAGKDAETPDPSVHRTVRGPAVRPRGLRVRLFCPRGGPGPAVRVSLLILSVVFCFRLHCVLLPVFLLFLDYFPSNLLFYV